MCGFSTMTVHVSGALIAPSPSPCRCRTSFGADQRTIRIGIIAEESAIGGVGIVNGARLAVDAINAAGGVDGRKLEIMQYDDHSSAADAVRAFQRAVSQDKVVAVIGTYISEVALALEPWAARTQCPASPPARPAMRSAGISTRITTKINIPFMNTSTSAFIADSICDSVKDLLQKKYSIKSAVVLTKTPRGPRRSMPSTWSACRKSA